MQMLTALVGSDTLAASSADGRWTPAYPADEVPLRVVLHKV